jgi:type II secretory ATPase GspE/PulE/Tfp pilus assembly ATPase PilB-like protein/8-oxo-dGTP pyrophosphatase MutT (NUDIX family)
MLDAWLLPILEDLTSSETAAAVAEQARGGSVWSAALRADVIDGEILLATISAKLKTPIAASFESSDEARRLLPERLARKYGVLPLRSDEATLDVATSNPWDLDVERALGFATGRTIRMWLASPPEIERRTREAYTRHSDPISHAIPRKADSYPGEPVVRLVDRVVAAGIEQRASDIHLEPEEDGIAVRYRVDGLLRHVMLLPRAAGVPLVSRIKIMAGMDIADRLRPQGGHASVGKGTGRVDLRVSTLPASHGEKVVIRILDPRTAIESLEALGLDGVDAPRMQRLLEVREGLVLVTGPTGSGKTTTLYAALRQIQRRGLNIVTVEDPVEYRIPGIVQVQINEKAGLSFATALRSILRQDPDVVLIGEIRDRETAAIAIQASLTGHLVFATLHTNDACTSITRLADLGVNDQKLAAALKGIIAQRLIRRLCPECRIVANDGVPAPLRDDVTGSTMVYTPVGCDRCAMSGYRGRLAVTEIVLPDADLERSIAAGAPVDVLQGIARRSGSRSLWESALSHLSAGVTSGDEVLRVLDHQARSDTNAVEAPGFDSGHDKIPRAPGSGTVTDVIAGVVDVYVIRPLPDGWKVLAVKRAPDARCAGAWETIHGRLNDGELPQDGAVREVREETGLEVRRLYNVTVQSFYLHAFGSVQMAIVFAAFVDEPADVKLGAEHQGFEWLSPLEAGSRFIWPREREALGHVTHLLAGGDAGPVEDVLRVF